VVNGQKLKSVKSLLNNKKFHEALAAVSECIENGNHSNEAYILKAKALEGLGRIGEAAGFFWRKINWNNPSNEDFEMVRLTEKAYMANNWKLISYRLNYMNNIMSQSLKSSVNIEVESKIVENLKMLEADPADYQVFLDLSWLYFAQCDLAKSAFYLMAYRYFCPNPLKTDELESGICLSYFPNISDIYMYLSNENKDLNTFAFVIERPQDVYSYTKMAQTLSLMNKEVIIISPPITFEVGNEGYDIEYFLNLSFENMEMIDNIKYYVPVVITRNGAAVESTTLPLLNEIAIRTNNHLPVFAERSTLDNLYSTQVSRKEIHYVFNGFRYKNAPTCTCFAYIRGYEKYISKLYKVNVINQLTAESKYAFSIVLPVRNNAGTLPYTLKTCMEQSFNDYEIVISDNSDDGNDYIYNLVKELDCDKIKYYRTPRRLPISKSFEYAYLKARGEFLVPIGADDAVLYNGLLTIDKVLKSYPEEDILLWDRLHYVWPNFIFKHQSDQFVIPRPYVPYSINVRKINSEEMLKQVLQFKLSVYSIPLLYINSGMKRSYLLKLLDKTGAIIDGISQDLYTGIANLAINKEFLYLQYPITIAALSSNSSGAISLAGNPDLEVQQQRDNEFLNTNIGNHVDRNLEAVVPVSDGDVANMIVSVLRLIDMQCIDIEVLNYFDWKQILVKITQQLRIDDMDLEPALLRLADAANSISSELYSWFIEQINSGKLSFGVYNPNSPKSYHKGFDANGSLNLDASEFGITNVYEASVFFRKLCNL